MNLAYECCAQGWDGYDASAIDPEAVYLAETLVRQLPAGIPLPEFTPEPDGSVSMDWIASPTRLFTLSVGTSHRLAYAWVDGADKGHAVARFDGETVPARISEGIRGIINHGGTAFRPL